MCGESRMHGVKRGKTRRLHQTVTYRYGAPIPNILGLTSTKTTELVQRTAGLAPPAAATLGCCKVSSLQPVSATAMPIIPVPVDKANRRRSTPAAIITVMEVGCGIRPHSTSGQNTA